jgi:hypothetical protein
MAIEYFREASQKYENSGGSTLYRALGTPHPDTGDVPYATLGVHHEYAETKPTFSQNQKGHSRDVDGSSGLSRMYLMHKHNDLMDKTSSGPLTDDQHNAFVAFEILKGNKVVDGRGANNEKPKNPKAWAVAQTQTNPHIAPDKLFFESSPAKTYITGMYADPSMKSAGINLLGVAFDDYNKTPFVADSSLTKFSSRLTQNAIKRGLPVVASEHNPDAVSTAGDYEEDEHVPHTVTSHHADNWLRQVSTPVSDLNLMRGKDSVREILGRKKRNPNPVTAKGLSDQFLPGMEGFV